MLDIVAEAAREAIDAGAAELGTSSVRELYGKPTVYDAPVVRLMPRNPAAAPIGIEVQDADIVTLAAGGGPYAELWTDRDDWEHKLGALVRAVVAGRYEYGWEEGLRRELFRPWRRKPFRVWAASFGTEDGPVLIEHFGTHPEPAGTARHTFEPYV